MLEKELCLFKKVWNKYICSSCYLSQPHLIQTGFVLSGTLDRESETAGRFFQPESQFRTGRWREHVFQNESISVWVLVLPSSDIYLMHDLELFFFFFLPFCHPVSSFSNDDTNQISTTDCYKDSI